MVNKVRKLLIRLGKILPFVICFLVFINYAESAFVVATSDYLLYDGIVIPNTPISFFVGRYFEYNIQMLVVLVILSISIQTCVYNKLACMYLCINLLEKSYIDFELEPIHVCVICIINMIVAGYITYNGIRILNKSLWI